MQSGYPGYSPVSFSRLKKIGAKKIKHFFTVESSNGTIFSEMLWTMLNLRNLVNLIIFDHLNYNRFRFIRSRRCGARLVPFLAQELIYVLSEIFYYPYLHRLFLMHLRQLPHNCYL